MLAIGAFFLIPSSKTKTITSNKECTVTNPNAKKDPTTFEKISATTAVMKTAKGDITLALYPNDAPKTVTNFATLAKNGYYDCLTFHRVVDDSIHIIQGGDPTGNGTGGQSIYGAKFEDELNPATQSFKDGYAAGVIAMANAGPNTNGSQFFINTGDNNAAFAKAYTIFGKVTAGLDVAKKIAQGDEITTVTVQ